MRTNWNTTPADIRYYTHFQAGPVASTAKTATELEDEIIAVAGYERGAAIVRQCWAGCAVIHVAKAKLQAALDELLDEDPMAEFYQHDAGDDADLGDQVRGNLYSM